MMEQRHAEIVFKHEGQIEHLVKTVDKLAHTVSELVEAWRETVRHEESTKSAHKRIDTLTAELKELRDEGGCNPEECPIQKQVDGLSGWHVWGLRLVVGAVILGLLGLIFTNKGPG